MITMIMDGDNVLNKIEFDFFLKGNTSLDTVEAKKPYEWITDNGWKDMQKLDTLSDTWTGFTDALLKNKTLWKDWYDLESPE
jgi:dynein heavy chain